MLVRSGRGAAAVYTQQKTMCSNFKDVGSSCNIALTIDKDISPLIVRYIWPIVNTFTFTFMHLDRRFYPKRLTSCIQGNTVFISMRVPWESNPQPFALLTQCSTTEPHRNTCIYTIHYTLYTILSSICTTPLTNEPFQISEERESAAITPCKYIWPSMSNPTVCLQYLKQPRIMTQHN